MKTFLIAAGFLLALGVVPSITPAQAQSAEEIRRICNSKHGLGKQQKHTASEERRREAARNIAACIRSGGKS